MKRYCEVNQSINSCKLVEHTIKDVQSSRLDHSDVRCASGGEVFENKSSPFMIQWRTTGNYLDLMVESLKGSLPAVCLRIACHDSAIVNQISLNYQRDELLVMLATEFSVHCLTVDILDTSGKLRVNSCHSYPVTTSSHIVHCSASFSHDDGIVFSVVNNDGHALAVIIKDGNPHEVQLKQSSLMNEIWSKVRRSIVSTSDDSEKYVCSQIDVKTDSIYCLTKNLHVRQYNIKSLDCMSNWNLLNYISRTHQVLGYSLKLVTHSFGQMLGVHLSDGPNYKLLLLNMESGRITTSHMLLDCNENELQFYDIISDNLFLIWKDRESSFSIQHINIADSDCRRMEVHLRTSPPLYIDVKSYEEPQEAFSSILFDLNRFNMTALVYAVSSMDMELLDGKDDVNLHSLEELKKLVCDLVAQQTLDLAWNDDATNEDYRDLQIETWKRFYSTALEYNEKCTEPLSVIGGHPSLPVALVKRNCVSYLRWCEPLEHQILFPSESQVLLDQDVTTITHALHLIESSLIGFQDHIYKSIVSGESLTETISQIVDSLRTSPDHHYLRSKLSCYMQNTHMLKEGIDVLRHLLDISNHSSSASNSISSPSGGSSRENPFVNMNKTSRNIVCTSVHDVTFTRFTLCCSVLVFLQYLGHLTEEVGQSEIEYDSSYEDMALVFHTLTKGYSSLLWISQLTLSSTEVDISAAFNDVLSMQVSSKKTFGNVKSTSVTSALDGYLCGPGGSAVKKYLVSTVDPKNYGLYVNSLVIATCQALWPDSNSLMFGDYLLSQCETCYLHIYCNMLENWCPSTNSIYLQAYAHLLDRNPVKAYKDFVLSLYSMFNDESSTSTQDRDTSSVRTKEQLNFCYQVMDLFEEFGFSEQVIKMAYQTMRMSDSQQEVLWSKIFKHNMELKEYDEAFKAILSTSDKDRKMDCLRQFVMSLCDAGEFSTLASYSYKDMVTQQDLRPAVISILLEKARRVDLTHQNYYNLIYSFHVFNNDLLSAANVMYECCERINKELMGLSALQQKAKCYLTCITALQCVPKESAWIVPNTSEQVRHSPKRTSQGQGKTRVHPQIRLLTLADIEKDYLLINMSLRLAKNGYKQITTGSQFDTSEIVTLLCNAGMYNEAVEVCTAYQLSLQPIFESLTFRCLRMSKRKTRANMGVDEQDEFLTWRVADETSHDTMYSSQSEQAWNLLQSYLVEHETVSTVYHKVVANKLLYNNYSLPDWLIASYQKRNVGELLRLYLQRDMIEEATDLSVEYLNSMTSATCDRFGLENPLSAVMKSSSVWCPYTTLDILTSVLHEHSHDPYYNKLYNKFNHAVQSYTRELEEKCKDTKHMYSIKTV